MPSSEKKVRAWWNALTVEQRRAEGRHMMGDGGQIYEDADWDADWDELSPMGQQMRLHMLYDGELYEDDDDDKPRQRLHR